MSVSSPHNEITLEDLLKTEKNLTLGISNDSKDIIRASSTDFQDFGTVGTAILPGFQVLSYFVNKMLVYSFIPVKFNEKLKEFMDLFNNFNKESFLRSFWEERIVLDYKVWRQINHLVPTSILYLLSTSAIAKVLNYCLILLTLLLRKMGCIDKLL